jgi:sugar lactone lactonase YvrE
MLNMTKGAAALAAAVLFGVAIAAPAGAWDRGQVDVFATLPAGAAGPEGITVDKAGFAYVATFDPTGATGAAEGQLYVFNPEGRLVRQVAIAGSSPALLGLDFNPATGVLLVIDFGKARVVSVNPKTGASAPFTQVNAAAGLNALTFDKQGNVYISDSFQGIIWKTPPTGGDAVAFVTDDLLKTTGTPPFGANGVAFNKKGDTLYVANTGNDTVVQIPIATDGSAGTPSVFVNSINGADGLIIDRHDNIWVAANQSDEIVVLDPTGKAIAKLGDFNGIDRNGIPRGLLFPASLVFDGGDLLVTNLALDLRAIGIPQSDVSQYAAEVKRFTVSRLKAEIPALSNSGH